MSQKYIEVEFQDGVYCLPVDIIASNRAHYYAEVECYSSDSWSLEDRINRPEYSRVYDVEFSLAMKDNCELIDWVRNNMDYEDIQEYLFKTSDRNQPSKKYQWEDEVAEGRLKVVEF